jgi:biopolymer transport protein ExbD
MGHRVRRASEEESEINITPMLDVVFILLIFFIVTASFVKEAGLDLSKPSKATKVVSDKASILVRIDDQNQVWVGDRLTDPRAVRANIERLFAQSPEAGVVIQAFEDSRNGLLVDVMDAARLAGVSNVSLAAPTN